MKKFFKKTITGSLISAAMLATSVCSTLAPMSTSAEIDRKGCEKLGATTFDDNVGLPWHTCETAPAKQTFDISDGKYKVMVVSNGTGADGRWDLQFRHRGIQITSGHEYYVHAEITCSADGWIYTKIGNYAQNKEYWNNAGEGRWMPVKLKKGETYVIDTTFVAGTELDPVSDGLAEWAFHYADHKNSTSDIIGEDTGVPEGATITFDNLSLQDLNDTYADMPSSEYGAVRPKSNVRLNQVGYFTKLRKQASYTTDAEEPLNFTVYDNTGEAVYTGKASKVIDDDTDSGTPITTKERGDGGKMIDRYKDSGRYVQILDFTDIPDTVTGDGFYIVVDDEVGVSGTQYSIYEGAFDTTVEDGKVMWENWKTGKSYQMNKSHPFSIKDEKVYGDLVRDAASYYYQNRSGVTIEQDYIKNGEDPKLAHLKFGHNPDKAYVQPKWVKAYSRKKFDGDTGYSVTATGGWYESDSHSKSVVNGGISVWTLQNLYEMSKKIGTDGKWDDGKTMSIPEGTNGAPDLLDEARVELEWFFKMIVQPEDPYWGDNGTSAEATGLVYHKLQDSKWTDLAIYAWDYGDFAIGNARIVKPPTYAATFNTIACAAQAARLWRGIDDDFADECIEKAKYCLAAVEKHKADWAIKEGNPLEQYDAKGTNVIGKDPLFAPLDQAVDCAPYGDTYVEDDCFWALCELFATTGDPDYYDKLMEYCNPNDATGSDKALGVTTNITGGENMGSLSSFNWGCTSGLGTLSLLLNEDHLSADDVKTVRDSIRRAADEYLWLEEESGMGIPYKGSTYIDDINIDLDENGNPIEISGYESNSNSFVVNNAILMAYAHLISGDQKYLDGASTAMDYIFGRNGNDFSYVSGYGDTELGTVLQYPRHTYWAAGVDPDFPKAPDGVLSGGPSAGLQDPYIYGLGYRRGAVANQKCYVDSAEAWSVNEISLSLNAPLLWMASFLEDKGAKEITPDPHCLVIWGDADQDSYVKMNDVVLIMQSISNADRFGLEGSDDNHITAKGQYFGDVYEHQDPGVITPQDALQIQKYLLKQIPDLAPEGK
ncbi:MAG TPA: glycoside hydrolase family 9 protein [Ruminococcus sp.]|nr:glycoside hydrolase family 9 protein [Ruminococcus sp.]